MATFTENCITSYIKLCKHYSDMAHYDASLDSAFCSFKDEIEQGEFRRVISETTMVSAAVFAGWSGCESLADFIGEDESFPYGPSWATTDILDPDATDENIKWFTPNLPAHDMWEMLKNCRVYCIDPQIYSNVYAKCRDAVFSEFYGFDHVSKFHIEDTTATGDRVRDNSNTAERRMAIFCDSPVDSDDMKDLAKKMYDPSKIDDGFQKLSKSVPFMSNLPFESMYLAYGDGIPLDAFQDNMRDLLFASTGEFTGSSKKLKGHMILPGGWVYEHIACDFTNYVTPELLVGGMNKTWHLNSKRDSIIKNFGISNRELATKLAGVGLDTQLSALKRYSHDKELPYSLIIRHGEGTPFTQNWPGAVTLAPWTLTAISELIAENSKSIIIKSGKGHTGLADTKDKRRAIGLPGKKKKSKHHQKNFPSFYVINLAPSVVESDLSSRAQRVASEGSGRSLQYRHDREGHERLLVKRGPLPLDLGAEAELLGRGYAIWEEGQPDMYTRSKLVLKRHPIRREDEWLAIKTTQVSSSVVGDTELPYRPAARHLSYGSVKDILDVSTA